jgi:hypothetical protein
MGQRGDNMNLYIFEPYDWDYCGGAIGIIADTFGQAVETIIAADKIQAKHKAKEWGLSDGSCRRYEPEYFQRSKEVFEDEGSDQWLLTHTIPLPATYIIPRVMFDNWNDA